MASCDVVSRPHQEVCLAGAPQVHGEVRQGAVDSDGHHLQYEREELHSQQAESRQSGKGKEWPIREEDATSANTGGRGQGGTRGADELCASSEGVSGHLLAAADEPLVVS